MNFEAKISTDVHTSHSAVA